MTMMLVVVACYTICSLSDKTAVAKLKFNGSEFTFLMAVSTAFFMLFTLPFVDRFCTFTWQTAIAVVLLALSKMLEFFMSALILKEMSAFELKAWLGLILFMSYATDIAIYNEGFNGICLLFICVTIFGLFCIAKSGESGIEYKKIVLPMIVYFLAKFGYGFIIKAFSSYVSSTMCLFFALILMSIVLLPKSNLIKNIKKKPKGVAFVSLTKIPNVAGLLGENAVIATSLTNYSFIQPMILVVLFFVGLIKRDKCSDLNLAGSIICIGGIVGFQLAKMFL